MIMDSDRIQCAIIDAHSPSTILLLHQKDWGGIWTRTLLDKACGEEFRDFFSLFQTFESVGSDMAVRSPK